MTGISRISIIINYEYLIMKKIISIILILGITGWTFLFLTAGHFINQSTGVIIGLGSFVSGAILWHIWAINYLIKDD